MRTSMHSNDSLWRPQARNYAILGGAVAFLLGLLLPVTVPEPNEDELRLAQHQSTSIVQ